MYRSAGSPTSLSAGPITSQRHFLRQSQREVLTEMIRSAVPLRLDGTPIQDEAGEACPSHSLSDGAHQNSAASGSSGRNHDTTYPNHATRNSFDKNTSSANTPASTVWRLLIFDDWGRDVIAPLMRVRDLRDLGVTLYMHLDIPRDAVPGAPALYLCAPTPHNITRIAADCAQELYEWVYLNFTSPVPRAQLEQLASLLAQSGLPSIRHIKLFDRTLNYTALENDLFSLMLPKSFATLHAVRGVNDSVIENYLNDVVTGLIHVLLSQQLLPVIAHSRSGAAEAVAQRLRQRLIDAIDERQFNVAAFSSSMAAVYGRPLLLLVDRATDLATALHHPFSYRGLLVELGHMHLNKCKVKSRDKDGVDEIVEVDPDKDAFYRHNADRDFAEIGSNIENALRQYKAEYAALAASSTDGSSLILEASKSSSSSHNSALSSLSEKSVPDESETVAMSRLLASAPRLAERKRYLDAHTKLAYSFLQVIRQRSLDRFHGVELGVMHHDGLDKEEFAKLLSLTANNTTNSNDEGAASSSAVAGATLQAQTTAPDTDKESVTLLADQQRLLLIAYLLCNEGNEESFVRQKLEAFASAHPFPALGYLKHLRQWSMDGNAKDRSSSANSSNHAPGGGGASNFLAAGQGLAWGFAQQIAKNIANSLGGSTDTDFPLTKLVDALLQDSSTSNAPTNRSSSGGISAGGAQGDHTAGYRGRGSRTEPGSARGTGAAGSHLDNNNNNNNQAHSSPTSSGSGSAGLRYNLIDSITAYDPRTNKPVDLHTARFSQAIVFALGGGCIAEYDNLKMWERARPRKSVCYGCTALMSGEELLAQLSELGMQVSS